MPWFVDRVFGHQSFDAELADLAGKYSPPHGRTMVARVGGRIVAGGAYRRRSERICEFKRLYVTGDARGLGLGRRIADALIAAARTDGFAAMRLDSGDRMIAAIALYGAMGFEPIAPYQAYPDDLMPHLVFMEKTL